ncbi:MAG TPA: ABC transporter ATP-binding protein [Polyangia bacterium]
MPPAPLTSRGTTASLRELLRLQSGRTWLPAALLVAVSLTDGLGLCLLIPLLALVGVDVGTGPSGRGAQQVLAAFDALHLPRSLAAVLPAYVVLVGSRALLQRWQSRLHTAVQADTVALLRTRLYAALGRAPWCRVSAYPHSQLAHALTFEADRVGYAAWGLLQAAAGTVILAIYALLALRVSPSMTLIGVGGAALVGVLLRRRLKAARRVGEEIGRVTRGLYAEALTHLAGMKTARSYGAWARSLAVFTKLTAQVGALHRRTVDLNTDVRCGLEIGGAVVLVVLFGTSRLLAIPVGAILFLAYLFYRAMPLVSSLQTAAQHVSGNLPALAGLLALERELGAEAEPAAEEGQAVALGDGVRLAGVCYRHPGLGDRDGLRDIDLVLARGALTAVVGPSGSGKTTLADLVLGLLRPDGGQVLVGGVPLAPAHLASWRTQIGYVPQETFLIAGTLRDNLRWARPEAGDDEMRAALREAAADFLDRLPAGLDTVLGDAGVGLSGGERQRLALARALLRRPSLIVGDEGTSALDAENATRIHAALTALRGTTTLLVLSHEPVPGADRTYLLDGGRLAAVPDVAAGVARARAG